MADVKASAEAEPTLRVPSEWARILGQVRPLPVHMGGGEDYTPEHKAARALHGWGDENDPAMGGDAHHATSDERLRITREDYERALAAPADCDDRGVPFPYIPALSPHVHGFEQYKARAMVRSAATVKGAAKPEAKPAEAPAAPAVAEPTTQPKKAAPPREQGR